MTLYILNWIKVLLAMTLADICWAQYFIKIQEKKSIPAGLWAILIYMFGALTITSYLQDTSMIIPAAIGAFLGTYLTVEYKKKKNKKEERDRIDK